MAKIDRPAGDAPGHATAGAAARAAEMAELEVPLFEVVKVKVIRPAAVVFRFVAGLFWASVIYSVASNIVAEQLVHWEPAVYPLVIALLMSLGLLDVLLVCFSLTGGDAGRELAGWARRAFLVMVYLEYDATEGHKKPGALMSRDLTVPLICLWGIRRAVGNPVKGVVAAMEIRGARSPAADFLNWIDASVFKCVEIVAEMGFVGARLWLFPPGVGVFEIAPKQLVGAVSSIIVSCSAAWELRPERAQKKNDPKSE